MRLAYKDYVVEYDYKHVPTIAKFAQSNKRIRGLMGPIGSGKSSGCVMELIRRGLMQEPSPRDGIRKTRWLIVRATYPQLRDTTIKTFHYWFPPHIFGEWKSTEHLYIINVFPNVHMEFLFRALDSPESISNLLSLEITGAWINEAREIDKEVFDVIDGRIGRYPPPSEVRPTWVGIIMDTNPPDTDSWWYHYFEEVRPEVAEIFRQPSGRSPQAENIKNLQPDYYKMHAIGKSEEYIRVYIDGKYGSAREGRPIISNFNDNLHTARQPLKPYPETDLIIGMDYGLSPAAVICQLTPRGYFYVLDEVVAFGVGIRNFIDNYLKPILNTKYRGFNVVGCGDPAGAQRAQTDEKTCFDELTSAGINITPARTNSLAGRVDAVENALSKLVDGEPFFQLSPECKMLRKALISEYKYKKSQSGDYTTVPEKNKYSHVAEALQYACLYLDDLLGSSYNQSDIVIPTKKYRPVSLKAGY